MSNTLKIGLRLVVVTVVAALLLGLTNLATQEPIRLQRIKAENAAKQAALPQAETFREIDLVPGSAKSGESEITQVFVGESGGETVGYVLMVKTRGYVDEVELVIGINNNDEVEAVQISKQSETPGLGARVVETAFLQQFHGLGIDATGDATADADGGATADTDGGATADADSSASIDADGGATTEIEAETETDADSSATADVTGGSTADADNEGSADADSGATSDETGGSTGEADSQETTDIDSGATDANSGATGDTDADAGATGDADADASATGDADADAGATSGATSSGDDQDIQAISGATVTSGAVTRAVNFALQYYRDVLLGGGAK
ncbi:MAG: hypothetical protein GX352_02920 [Clostridiales bacterium]|mgnify:CR=1 FL=1|nr:hypothetical protein [Clostridiales bacterium]